MDTSTQTECSWFCDRHQCSFERIDDDSYEVTSTVDNEVNENRMSTTSITIKESEGSLNDLMDELHMADSDASDSDDNNGEEMEADTERPPLTEEPPYTLSTDNLPWPKLLQYLRESESAASKYFSFPTVHQSGAAKRRQDDDTLVVQDSSDKPNATLAPSVGSTIIANGVCDFCGKELLTINIENDSPTFCCNDYKEFCVLLAVYTKRMMDDKINKMPGNIFIEKSKVRFKKTAEEKALERLRRKRRWEDNERKMKMLESSNFHSLPRQTRLIHFSLASPTCMTRKWTEKDRISKSKQRRLLTPLHSSVPLPLLISDAPEEDQKHILTIQRYNRGYISAINLPDGTGQSVSYTLLEDKINGSIIGYFDELGRGWLNKEDGSIRFVSTLSELYIFEHHGRLKNILWSDSLSVNFLPLILKINRYLSVKYNSQADVTISVISEHQHHKFRIFKKMLNKSQLPIVVKKLTNYTMQIEKIKLRFKSHLDCFERVAKLMRSGPLPPIGVTIETNTRNK